MSVTKLLEVLQLSMVYHDENTKKWRNTNFATSTSLEGMINGDSNTTPKGANDGDGRE